MLSGLNSMTRMLNNYLTLPQSKFLKIIIDSSFCEGGVTIIPKISSYCSFQSSLPLISFAFSMSCILSFLILKNLQDMSESTNLKPIVSDLDCASMPLCLHGTLTPCTV